MKEKSSVKLSLDILQLQNLIKRDPTSYYEDFIKQYNHYKTVLELFKYNASEYDENVAELIRFLAQVSSYYKEDMKDFPSSLIALLQEYASLLDPSMRMCIVQSLILMRNRGLLSPTDLLTQASDLLRCKDKVLRKMLQVHIVTDLKNINIKNKNMKVNAAVLGLMYKMLNDSHVTAAKVSLDVMIELYKRNVWKNDKCVNAIASACFSKVNKILVGALHFFLGVDDEEENEDSDSEEDNVPNVRDVMKANKVNKKSRKREKTLKRTKHVLQKAKKRKNKGVSDFSAIHLLHDPQGMAEKLLKNLQSMNERYEIKLLVMNLVSRLVGIHELVLLNFYPLLIRFLKPHQREVTKILMFTAQASHKHVPPDAIEPVIKAIAYNFITERNSTEVITVGLNAIRKICERCPYAIDRDLLGDLVQYQKYKNKNVIESARSLVRLFQAINPKMLQKRDRTRPTESVKELEPTEFGTFKAKSFIPGSEFLPLEPTNDDACKSKTDDDANDSDDSWVDISHSEDEIEEDVSENLVDKVENATEKQEDCEVATSPNEANLEDSKITNAEQKSSENVSETVIEDKDKAMSVSHSRIFSQDEFKKIQAAQLAKQVRFIKGKKRKSEALLEPESKNSEIVSLREIEKLHKKPKADKESRLATVLEGRDETEKFSKKKKGKNPNSGKTQKEHNKNKAFMMIKYKVKSKIKRSFKDKQIALRDSLLKRKRNYR